MLSGCKGSQWPSSLTARMLCFETALAERLTEVMTSHQVKGRTKVYFGGNSDKQLPDLVVANKL